MDDFIQAQFMVSLARQLREQQLDGLLTTVEDRRDEAEFHAPQV
jgi:hypothetical protein